MSVVKESPPRIPAWLLVRREEVMGEDFVHREHMHPILLENSFERIVASDLPLVLRILELMFLEIGPKPLQLLRPREMQ